MSQKPQNKIAFVLGNGTSRLTINSKELLSLGTMFACNAVYREFSPHYLVAVDAKMVNEIVESTYHATNEVWTNPNRGLIEKEHLNFFNPHKGWSSGPTALWFACTKGFTSIYILGFDYSGIDGKLNNVYADTYNYKASTDAATYHGNWLNQTESVIKEYDYINFYRVIADNSFVPEPLTRLTNLKHINYSEFINIFPEARIKIS